MICSLCPAFAHYAINGKPRCLSCLGKDDGTAQAGASTVGGGVAGSVAGPTR